MKNHREYFRMDQTNCPVCEWENIPNQLCNHDENTVFLMAVWLKSPPKSLLEFYICVYHELSLLDTDKDINSSVKKFVQYYKLFE